MKDLRVPILVTGGAGFIGSHLVKRLVKEGSEVHVIDKADGLNLEEVTSQINFYDADLRDEKLTKKIISGINPRKVFHLAACINRTRHLDAAQEVIENNIIGAKNLVEALEKTDYERLVSVGTCEEYGNQAPFKETMREDPSSPYSWSKTCVNNFLRMRDNLGKKKTVILRPTVVYGENQKTNLLIPAMIVSVLNEQPPKLVSGRQTRDWIYVSDMVEAYIKAATMPNVQGQTINIGSGKETSVKDIVSQIFKMTGKQVPEFGTIPDPEREIYSYYTDTTKAREYLTWEAKVSLEEGLNKTMAWYARMYEQGKLGKWIL